MSGLHGMVLVGSSPAGQRIRAAGLAFELKHLRPAPLPPPPTPVPAPKLRWVPMAEPRAAVPEPAKQTMAPIERAAAALAALTPPTKRLTQIIVATAAYFGLTVAELRSSCRDKRLILPRHLVCYLAREAGYSFPDIGRSLGERDHTTGLYGDRKVRRILIIESDPSWLGIPEATGAARDVQAVLCAAGKQALVADVTVTA